MSESTKRQQQQSSLKQQADSFFQKQDYKNAIELYTQAIEVDPSCEAAAVLFSNRSLCHHKLDNFQEALNDGVLATSIRPTWSRGHLRVANAAESLNQNEKALEAYEKSLELDSANVEVKQKYDKLLKRYLETLSSTKNQDEIKQFGNLYFGKKKYNEAILIYNAAIDLDPSVETAAAIYSNRSASYYNIDKFQEAHDDGAMATILRPEWPRGWLRRGSAAVKIENYEDAHECFEKYFELDPEGAKQDEIAISSFVSVKKKIRQIEEEKRKNEERLRTTRKELLSIKNPQRRTEAAGNILSSLMQHPEHLPTFDSDLARLVITCAPKLLESGDTEVPMRIEDLNSSNITVLNMFLVARMRRPLSKSELAKFDDLIAFVIAEMVRLKFPIPKNILGCTCTNLVPTGLPLIPPNPNIIRALLQTGQVDPNAQGFGNQLPLLSLVQSSGFLTPEGAVHPQIMACLDALLGFKGISIDAAARDIHDSGMKTALMVAQHPDVAKLLLRHGADVNAEGERGNDVIKSKTNALDCAAAASGNPYQTELLHVLTAAGARLINDGKDGKSSSTMFFVFNNHSISEDALQILLQLNKKQGLLMRYQTPEDVMEQTFLNAALFCGSSARVVELLCGMDPSAVNEYSSLSRDFGASSFGKVRLLLMPIETVAMCPIERTVHEFEQLYSLLLDRGAHLMRRSYFGTQDGSSTVFHTIIENIKHNCGTKVFEVLRVFEKIVKEKRGQEYYNKCLQSWDVDLYC